MLDEHLHHTLCGLHQLYAPKDIYEAAKTTWDLLLTNHAHNSPISSVAESALFHEDLQANTKATSRVAACIRVSGQWGKQARTEDQGCQDIMQGKSFNRLIEIYCLL